jgi:hypothetical protein
MNISTNLEVCSFNVFLKRYFKSCVCVLFCYIDNIMTCVTWPRMVYGKYCQSRDLNWPWEWQNVSINCQVPAAVSGLFDCLWNKTGKTKDAVKIWEVVYRWFCHFWQHYNSTGPSMLNEYDVKLAFLLPIGRSYAKFLSYFDNFGFNTCNKHVIEISGIILSGDISEVWLITINYLNSWFDMNKADLNNTSMVTIGSFKV